MHSLFEDSSDLLRERSMLSGRAATKRFLEVVWNVCAYENAFAISHQSVASLLSVKTINPAIAEQVYKPNSVLRLNRSGDHSSSPAVAGWLQRPTRRS